MCIRISILISNRSYSIFPHWIGHFWDHTVLILWHFKSIISIYNFEDSSIECYFSILVLFIIFHFEFFLVIIVDESWFSKVESPLSKNKKKEQCITYFIKKNRNWHHCFMLPKSTNGIQHRLYLQVTM